MAITVALDPRNDAVDAVLGNLDEGVGASPLFIIKDAADVVLGQVPMNNTSAFNAASGGAAIANGLPLEDPTADASGIAAKFDAADKDGNVVFNGTCSVVGGGGDIEMADINVVQNQPIRITAATFTQPAS